MKKDVSVSLRLSREGYEQLRVIAEAEDIPISAVIRRCLRAQLGKPPVDFTERMLAATEVMVTEYPMAVPSHDDLDEIA